MIQGDSSQARTYKHRGRRSRRVDTGRQAARATQRISPVSHRLSCRSLHQGSKIRQDLLANAGYDFGKLPDPRDPDRFRVRLVDRPV